MTHDTTSASFSVGEGDSVLPRKRFKCYLIESLILSNLDLSASSDTSLLLVGPCLVTASSWASQEHLAGSEAVRSIVKPDRGYIYLWSCTGSPRTTRTQELSCAVLLFQCFHVACWCGPLLWVTSCDPLQGAVDALTAIMEAECWSIPSKCTSWSSELSTLFRTLPLLVAGPSNCLRDRVRGAREDSRASLRCTEWVRLT